VRRLLRRYSRARGTAVRKKEPLLIEQLPAILMAMPDDLPAMRDRALLLLGYAGAFRRSELVALDVEQLRFSKAGMLRLDFERQERSAEERTRALRATLTGNIDESGALRRCGARALACDRRAGRGGLPNVRPTRAAHGHAT